MKFKTFQKGDFILPLTAAALVMSLATYQGARHMYGDTLVPFIKGIMRNPIEVGACAPCSKYVAKEMTRHINPTTDKIHVLEVGAGTGAFTSEIEAKLIALGQPYQFDVVEIDAGYCAVLKEKFKNNPHVVVHCVSILDWAPSYKYNYVISSLPLQNFSVEFIADILDQYESLISPDGTLSYIEYMWLPSIKMSLLRGDRKLELEQKINTLLDFRVKHGLGAEKVYLNIPPTYVYHLRQW